MQAEVRLVGDPLMLDHIAFPQISQKVSRWIEQQIYAPVSHLVGIGADMMQYAKTAYEDLNNTIRLSNIKNALRNMSNEAQVDPNIIQNINKWSDVCTANPMTQRYIMAMPELRTLFHQQRADGFSGSYFDTQPDSVGKDHYDYCRVMDGVVHEATEKVDEHHNFYFQEDLFEEGQIDAVDKSIVASIWAMIPGMLSQGKDPSMIR